MNKCNYCNANGTINELAERQTTIIPADATSLEDIDKLISKSMEILGKIDFILHSMVCLLM